ncbi:pilus assembly protein TadG-related protein [Rhodoblastus sp. 17X3]|uniref:pilus assembly protein TadG-related protein n=1 Tax=Rhodoblastus sp. 17X3 TaxID=3047026 RepID=UPI0024B6C728|nr:pilus assembly protein TadG-related protein [Rhodoblastus sp. 17X3]MDI9848849.1 pilus assembly protein TadG-related protein [Rhodoblastus sp. 17X3]
MFEEIFNSAKFRRAAKTFYGDESGVVLPLVGIMMVALIGLSALALDMPRYFDLQTQLQKAADACALAAAAELDGRSDAITRAQNAITTLVASNSSQWAGVAQCSNPPGFYASLPSSDASAMGATTANANQARFVQVTATTASTMSSFFPLTLLGMKNNNLPAQALAVAGFTQAICKDTPIFVCTGTGSQDMTNEAAMKGKEVMLVAPPGSAYSPGNFGFLNTGCNGAPCLNMALGANDNKTCVDVNQIDTSTGQKATSANYLNTRFGIYAQSANNADPTVYSPDVNVRDGYYPKNSGKNACSSITLGNSPSTSCPYPDDSNINSGFCPGSPNYATAAIGNGSWQGAAGANLTTYWTTNYGSGGNAPAMPAASSVSTRYDLYQYEINTTFKGAPLTQFANKSNATGAPTCNPAKAQADRRLLYAAVVDCTQLGNGKTTARPMGVVTFFLLQPAEGSGFGSLPSEYVRYSAPNDKTGIVHDVVKLYR